MSAKSAIPQMNKAVLIAAICFEVVSLLVVLWHFFTLPSSILDWITVVCVGGVQVLVAYLLCRVYGYTTYYDRTETEHGRHITYGIVSRDQQVLVKCSLTVEHGVDIGSAIDDPKTFNI